MNKKIRILILIVIIILLVLIVTSTYSKYSNFSAGTIKEIVGIWRVKINGKDITFDEHGNTPTFSIENFTWDWENVPNVEPPKVAPGMSGFFFLEIDPTDSQVSMEYTITIDDTDIIYTNSAGEVISTETMNFEVTGISVEGKVLELNRNENGHIVASNVKKLSEIQSEDEDVRLDDVKVEITWENDDENNEIDSKLGTVLDGKITLPVNVRVTQWTGENT